MLSIERLALIPLPIALLGSAYLVFQNLVALFGLKLDYLGGFLFYWTVWCFLFSWWLLGANQMLQLFRDMPNRLGRPAWIGGLFLVVPLALGYGYAFPRAIREADAVIISASDDVTIPLASGKAWRRRKELTA